jgi:hypothetical protein
MEANRLFVTRMLLPDGQRLRRKSFRRPNCELGLPGLLSRFERWKLGCSELGDVPNRECVRAALCWASYRYVSQEASTSYRAVCD